MRANLLNGLVFVDKYWMIWQSFRMQNEYVSQVVTFYLIYLFWGIWILLCRRRFSGWLWFRASHYNIEYVRHHYDCRLCKFYDSEFKRKWTRSKRNFYKLDENAEGNVIWTHWILEFFIHHLVHPTSRSILSIYYT